MSPEADSSILVTPGTTATVAYEAINGKLYETQIFADAYGELQGGRKTYAVSDRQTRSTANAWYLTLYNDSTSTFIEVTNVLITHSTSANLTGAPPRLFSIYRISIKNGGTNASFSTFDTANTNVIPRIKAARRPTSATIIGTPIAALCLGPLHSGGNSFVALFPQRPTTEPILLRPQQGIGIQGDGVASTNMGLISTMIYFRVRP